MRKEVISEENSNMLNQLIFAFGTCVCSTVPSQWPYGRKISRGETRSHAVQNLQQKKDINSIIGLSLIDTPNAEIEYTYQKEKKPLALISDTSQVLQKLPLLCGMP